MSDFIVIAPSEYVQVDRDTFLNSTGCTIEALLELSQDVKDKLAEAGLIPEGKYIIEFTVIEAGLWAKFGDI